MSNTMTVTETEVIPAVEELKATLGEIEMKVLTSYTLADAIREGCGVTRKLENGWMKEDEACALSAAWIAAKARGYV